MLHNRRSFRQSSSHARSSSYPESVNLSLLSFSCSLSTIPSLASEAITASLSSISFPDNIPIPKESPSSNILPLNVNLLLLSSPQPPDTLSSNQSSRSRATLAAPTSPRLRNISKESSCIKTWVHNLVDRADPPGHVPWGETRAVKHEEWIAEGSMYPPAKYSKVITEIHGRRSRRDASRGVVASTRLYLDQRSGGAIAPSNAPKTSIPSSNPTSATRTAQRVSPTDRDRTSPATVTTQATSSLLLHQDVKPKPRTENAEKSRSVSPRQDTRGGTTRIPLPRRKPQIPRAATSKKRSSIATCDMINSLRVQCATLTVQTPPPDQSSHTIEPSAATVEFHARSDGHDTDGDWEGSSPGSKNDFGSRLSTLYPAPVALSLPKNMAEATLKAVHFRPGQGPQYDSPPLRIASSTSSANTEPSSEDDRDCDAEISSHHSNISLHRRNLSQMFKSSRFFSSSRGDDEVGKGRVVNFTSSTIPQKKLDPIIKVKKMKEVRFAPLPTTIRRYPPGPSDLSDSDDDCRDTSVEFIEYEPRHPRIVGTWRPRAQSPWLPDLGTFGRDSNPNSHPSIRSSSLRRSTVAPQVPLISQPVKPTSPRPSTTKPEARPVERVKPSFARRSLSRIMKIEPVSKDKYNRPISVGLPSVQSYWSIDENGARRDEVTSPTKSRIPLPRLRLGNIFSRFA